MKTYEIFWLIYTIIITLMAFLFVSSTLVWLKDFKRITKQLHILEKATKELSPYTNTIMVGLIEMVMGTVKDCSDILNFINHYYKKRKP